LWALLRQWALAPAAAFVGAAAFALHPVHVEPVASPGFREDVISALGLLAMALLMGLWRGGRAPTRVAAGLGFAAVFGAQMAKENALMAPALAAALAWADPWPQGAERSGVRRAWPFLSAVALATVVSACIRFMLLVDMNTPPPRPLAPSFARTAAYAPWIYAEHGLAPVLWPVRLRPDRVVNMAQAPLLGALGGWVVVGLMGGAVVALGRFWRRGSAGLLWYGLAWAPTSNLAALFNPAAERYAYLPDIGLAMLLGMGASALAERIAAVQPPRQGLRRLGEDASALGATVLLVALGALTFQQARLWKDPATLWSHALALEPSSVPARNSLAYLEWTDGQKAKSRGDREAAEAHLKKAFRLFREALEINPNDKQVLYNYGSALAEIGAYDRAEPMLRRVVQEFPNDPKANHNLGCLYAARYPPDKDKALQCLLRAKELGFPENEEALKALQAEVEGQRKADQ
jgi:tetratricopeptide (TPR) repeat protein